MRNYFSIRTNRDNGERVFDEKTLFYLRESGLKEEEAEVYLTLLNYGPSSAKEISYVTEIERTNVYQILNKLIEKGFVVQLPIKPKRFKAMKPSTMAKKLIKREEEKIKRIEEVFKDLSKLINTSNVKNGLLDNQEIWELRGRRNIYEKMDEMVSDPIELLYILTSENGVHRMYMRHGKLYKKLASRGTRFRLMAPVTERNIKTIKELEKFMEIKNFKNNPAKLMLVDRREVIFFAFNPDDLNIDVGNDVGFWTNYRVFVETIACLVENTWNFI
jgi:sugar-specific transcriptional regulator TrmB